MAPSPSLRRVNVIALLVVGCIAAALVLSARRPRDFAVYIKGADRIVQGEQIYRTDDEAAFTYPPFFALPYTPLLGFSPRVQLFLWSLTNCALLVLTLKIVSRWVWPQIREGTAQGGPKPAWIWLTIAVLSGRYLISPLEYQAHDLIVLLLVLAGGKALAVSRPSWAGAGLGLAAACKATPLLFLPVLALQKRWRACAALAVVLVAATLLPDLLFPSRTGKLWVTSWYQNFVSKVTVGASPEAGGAWARWDILNQSLPGTLYRLTTPADNQFTVLDVCLWPLSESQQKVLTLGIEAIVLGLVGLAVLPGINGRWRPEDQAFATFGQVGVVLCGMLLLSPMSSKHHFCALVVPITFAVVHYAYRRRDPLVAISLGLMFLVGTLGAKDLAGDAIGNRLQAAGSLTWCTLVCLIASNWILIRGGDAVCRGELKGEADPGRSLRPAA